MELDYRLKLPNDLRAIERSVHYLMERGRQVGFSEDLLRLNLRVGVTEAIANAMLYGNCRDPKKHVRVEAHFSTERLVVQVTDEGSGFDPGEVSDPTSSAGRHRVGGRGIFLIRKLMDQVEFNDRGNSVTMILLNHPSAAQERASGS